MQIKKHDAFLSINLNFSFGILRIITKPKPLEQIFPQMNSQVIATVLEIRQL